MYEIDWPFRGARTRPASAAWHVPANIWGLGITSFLTDTSSEMVVSILPAYLVMTVGFAPLMFGVANGLHEGGPIIASLLGGVLADRTGRRKLTAGVGYSLSAACRLGWLLLSSGTLAPVAALIVSDRLGKSLRTAPRDALISASVPADRLATAFGVHRALDAAGAAVGPVLAFVLLWQMPRRYDVIFVTSFVIAVLGAVALVLLVDDPGTAASRRAVPRRWPDVFALVGDHRLRRVLALALAFGVFTISDAFIYLLLIQRSQASSYWIPLLYMGTAVAFLLLAVPLGRVADRVGRRRVFVCGHAPLLLAYLVATGGLLNWPWSAVTCVTLLGTYYACADGVLASLASGVLPERTRAMGLAWVATAIGAGRLSSSVLFGLLWGSWGQEVAVATFATGLVAVAALAFPGRDHEGRLPA